MKIRNFFRTRHPVKITPVLMIHGSGDSPAMKELLKQSMDKPSRILVYNLIAHSQFMVIQHILNNPTSIVCLEGLVNNTQKAQFINHSPEEYKLIKKSFKSSDFEKSFDELNSIQKKLLRKHLAPFILLSLDLIPVIYASISKELYDQLTQQFFNNKQALTLKNVLPYNQRREKEALMLAVKASQQTKAKNVLLLFGGGHDFTQYQSKEFKIEAPVDCTLHLAKKFFSEKQQNFQGYNT